MWFHNRNDYKFNVSRNLTYFFRFIVIFIILFCENSSLRAQDYYFYNDFYDNQYFINIESGEISKHCRKRWASDGAILPDSTILHNSEIEVYEYSTKFNLSQTYDCITTQVITFPEVFDTLGMTGLTVDHAGNLYGIPPSFNKNECYIIKYDKKIETFEVIDTLPYVSLNDYTFYNGYLFFVIMHSDFSDARYILYDIHKRKIVKELRTGFSKFEKFTDNLAATATPCQTKDIYFVSDDYLNKMDMVRDTSQQIHPLSSNGSSIGATTSEYLASMPEVYVDSVIVDTPSCEGAMLGGFTLSHRYMYGRGIVYTLVGRGVRQTDSVFVGLEAGDYVVHMEDTIWGCDYYTDTIRIRNRIRTEIEIEEIPASCGKMNGSLKIKNIGKNTKVIFEGKEYRRDTIIKGIAPGEYEVRIIESSGCEGSKRVRIAEKEPPGLRYEVAVAHCGNTDGRIRIIADDEPGLEWKVAGAEYDTITEVRGLGKGTYSVMVRDSLGCVMVYNIAVGEYVLGEIGVKRKEDPYCGRADGLIEVEVGEGETVAYRIDGGTWQETGIFPDIESGVYVIEARDSLGCLEDTIVQIRDIPGPKIKGVHISEDHCGMGVGVIEIEVEGVDTMHYSLEGMPWNETGIFEGLKASTYQVRVEDKRGCDTIFIVEVGGISGPEIKEIESMPSGCKQEDGGIEIQAEGHGLSYRKGGGDWQIEGRFEGLSAGEYQIEVRDSFGCISGREVVVEQAKEPFFVSIKTRDEHCFQGDGMIVLRGEGKEPLEYRIESKDWQEIPQFEELSSGNYKIWIRDGNGCENEEEVEVFHTDVPRIREINVVDLYCGRLGGLEVEMYPHELSFTYSVEGVGENVDGKFTDMNEGIYRMRISDGAGCEVDTMVAIDKIPELEIIIEEIGDDSCGQENRGNIRYEIRGGSTYKIFLGEEEIENTGIIEGLSAGEYRLRVEEDSCIKERGVQVKQSGCGREVYIPTAISPNDDGINDILKVYTGEEISRYMKMEVYDKWGQRVFFQTGKEVSWEGRGRKGEKLETGVYTYIIYIAFSKGDKTIHGEVMVLDY